MEQQQQEQRRAQETELIDNLCQFALELQTTQKTRNPQAVVGAILSWTSGQQELTARVCQAAQMVLSDRGNRGDLPIPEDSIPEGREAEWVEQLIRACTIEQWETQVVAARHLLKIRNVVVKQKQQAFWLLQCYRQILEQGQTSDRSREAQQELLELGLIAQRRSGLAVHNRIYREVFNLSWIERTTLDLRPYLKPFADWQASQGCNKARFLRGPALQEALTWAADKSEFLSPQEHQFLIGSQVLDRQDFSPIWQDGEREAIARVQDLVGRVSHPQTVVRALLRWTQGQEELLRSLCTLVGHGSAQSPTSSAELEIWIDRIVETKLLAEWETAASGEPLRQLRDRLLEGRQNAWARLNCYLNLLQQGQLAPDSSSEQEELLDLGLVVSQQGAIAVANPIYAAVFSQQWIEQNLVNQRPYEPQIAAWLQSQGRDNRQLLSGQSLRAALSWVQGKTLHPQDIRFLKLSQIWDLQDIQKADAAVQNLALKTARPLLGRARNCPAVIQSVLDWTGGQQARLVEAVCRKILATQTPIPDRGEKAWVEDAVRSPILVQWETIAPLRELRDRLLNSPQGEQAIATYQQILQSEPTSAAAPAAQVLLDLGLVAVKQGQLHCANRIYQTVFDSQWVERELEKIRAREEEQTAPQTLPEIVNFNPTHEAQPPSPLPESGPPRSLSWKPHQTIQTDAQLVALAFSADGQTLVSLGDRYLSNRRTEHLAIVWNPESGKKQQTHYLPHSDLYRYQAIAFTPEHQLLACACLTKKVAIFDVQRREMLRTLTAHVEGVTFATFSPDGQILISGSRQGHLKLWNPSTGDFIESKKSKLGILRGIAMGADRQTLAMIDAQSTISVYLNHGKIRRFNSPNDSLLGRLLQVPNFVIDTVAFDPNQYILASGGGDRKIRLWNLRNQQLHNTLSGHSGEITAIAFSPDGRTFASSSRNGEIKIWRLSSE